MPYDTHGGGHRGESRLYCPGTEVKFSEMTIGAQRHELSRKISVPSEDNIGAQCRAPFASWQRTRGAQRPESSVSASASAVYYAPVHCIAVYYNVA